MEAVASKISDNEIVERVLSGEKELYELLLRRHNQLLYRVIRSYLKEDEDVEDAMQEAYLHAYEKLRQFKGSAAFSTWLVRIGINEALMRLRRQRKNNFVYVNVDAGHNDEIDQIVDNMSITPDKKVIQVETRALLERAIDQLPEKYRLVFVMKEVEGMEHAQIAECLDISGENVKVRLHRAKEVLKETLYNLSPASEAFPFGHSRCDGVVARVMARILDDARDEKNSVNVNI